MKEQRPAGFPALSASERAAAGLCGNCRHARATRNARGSVFWRCGRSDAEPSFPRYPPLPVRACPGFEATAGAC